MSGRFEQQIKVARWRMRAGYGDHTEPWFRKATEGVKLMTASTRVKIEAVFGDLQSLIESAVPWMPTTRRGRIVTG